MEQQFLTQINSTEDDTIINGLFDMIQELTSGTKLPALLFDCIAKIMMTENGPKNKLVRQLCYDTLAMGCSDGNDNAPKAIIQCSKTDLVSIANPDITLSALRAIQSLQYRYQFEFVRTLKPDYLKKPLLHENPSVRQQAIRTFISLVLRIFPTLNTPPIPFSYESQLDRTMNTTDCRDHINDIMRGILDMRSDKDDRVLLELYTQLSMLFNEYYTHNIVSIDTEIHQLESADDYEKITSGGNALLPLLVLIVKLSLPQIKMIAGSAQYDSMVCAGMASLYGSQILSFALNNLQSTGLIYDCGVQLESTTTPLIEHIKQIALEWGNYTLMRLLSSSIYDVRFNAAKGLSLILDSELLICPTYWGTAALYSIIPLTMNNDRHAHADLARIIVSLSKQISPNIYLQKLNKLTFYELLLRCILYIDNTNERLKLLKIFHQNYINRCVVLINTDNSDEIKFLLEGEFINEIFNTVTNNSFREELAYTVLLPFVTPPTPLNQSWVKVVLPYIKHLLQCLFWKSDAPSGHVIVKAINNIYTEINNTYDNRKLLDDFSGIWNVLLPGLPKIKLPLILNILLVITQYISPEHVTDEIVERIRWVFDDINEKEGDEQLIMLLRSVRIFGLRIPKYANALLSILQRELLKENLSGFVIDEMKAASVLLKYQNRKNADKSILNSYKKPSSNINDRDFGFSIANLSKLDYHIQCEVAAQDIHENKEKEKYKIEIAKTFKEERSIPLTSSNDPIYVTARKRLCPSTSSFLIEFTLYNLTNVAFKSLKLNLAINGKVKSVPSVVLPTPLYSNDKITIPYNLKLNEISPFQCILYINYLNIIDPNDIYPKCTYSNDLSIKTSILNIDLNDLLWSPELIPELQLYRMIWNSLSHVEITILQLSDNIDTLEFRLPWKKIEAPLILIEELVTEAAVVNNLTGTPIYGVLYPFPNKQYNLTIKSKDADFIKQFITDKKMFMLEWFGDEVTIVDNKKILHSCEVKSGEDLKEMRDGCLKTWKNLKKRRNLDKKEKK